MVHIAGLPAPIACDLLLFATGRRPNTGNLGLEAAGVELNEKGAVKVDADSRSTCPSIFAVGDVTDRVQLTLVAIREGQAPLPTRSSAAGRARWIMAASRPPCSAIRRWRAWA